MYKCELCGKEYKRTIDLSRHIKLYHPEITSKEYYDKYLKKEGEGICQHCGKSTEFKNISLGYKKHCCRSCADFTGRKHAIIKHSKYIEFAKTINISEIKELYKTLTALEIAEKLNINYRMLLKFIFKNNIINSAEEKREKEVKKQNKMADTREKNYGDKNYMLFGSSAHKEAFYKKYHAYHPSQVPEIKQKMIEHTNQHYCRKGCYFLDGLYFDSKWELSVYIYFRDEGATVIRNPKPLPYYKDGKIHYYHPDFIINNEYIEVKGPNLQDNYGHLYDWKRNRLYEKEKCMEDNNVCMISIEDTLCMISYVNSIYGDTFLNSCKVPKTRNGQPLHKT